MMQEVRDTVGKVGVWWECEFAILEGAEGERNDGRTPSLKSLSSPHKQQCLGYLATITCSIP